MPTLARTYETAGHLVNGSFSLPQPLQARAVNAANPTSAYVPLAETSGQPTPLLAWSGPVNADPVTLGFRQGIGASDVLRSGTYSKTLTFTLSTTSP